MCSKIEVGKNRIGIVGATGTAFKRVLPALKQSKLCCVSAIQGRNAEKLSLIAKEYGISTVIPTKDGMFNSDEYDILYIATPPFLHTETILRYLPHGKPIICEKPLTFLADDFGQLESIGPSLGKSRFMLAHHLRHQECVRKLKSIINSSALGNISKVSMEWRYIMDKSNSNYLWKKERGLGGDAISDIGSHMIDMSLTLFGSPKEVKLDQISSSLEDVSFILKYDNFEVSIRASQCSFGIENDLNITCTNGNIIAKNFFGEHSTKEIEVICGKASKRLTFNSKNPYLCEFENFASLINGKQRNYIGTTFEEAMETLRIINTLHD